MTKHLVVSVLHVHDSLSTFVLIRVGGVLRYKRTHILNHVMLIQPSSMLVVGHGRDKPSETPSDWCKPVTWGSYLPITQRASFAACGYLSTACAAYSQIA
jgi:hypothetical protein